MMRKMGFTFVGIVGIMMMAAFAAQPYSALAQNGPGFPPPPGAPRPPRPPSPAQTIQLWTTVLGLSTDEQTAIQPILQKQQDDGRALMQDPNLAPRDRMTQLNAIHTAANAQVRALLTADQQTKFDALQSLMALSHPRPPQPGGPGAAPPAPPAPPDPAALLPLWNTILGLTADEQTALKPILQKEYDDAEAVLKDDSTPPPAKRGQIDAIHRQSNVQFRALLTADQQKVFDALELQMRPPRGGPGFPPPPGGGPGFPPPPDGGPGFPPPPGQ